MVAAVPVVPVVLVEVAVVVPVGAVQAGALVGAVGAPFQGLERGEDYTGSSSVFFDHQCL